MLRTLNNSRERKNFRTSCGVDIFNFFLLDEKNQVSQD